MNLILIAPPAAGKGTLASELNEKEEYLVLVKICTYIWYYW